MKLYEHTKYMKPLYSHWNISETIDLEKQQTKQTSKLEPKHAIQYHLCEKLYVWKEEYNHFIEEYM